MKQKVQIQNVQISYSNDSEKMWARKKHELSEYVQHEWKNVWISEQVNEWENEWISEQVTEWVNEWENEWIGEQVNKWVKNGERIILSHNNSFTMAKMNM